MSSKVTVTTVAELKQGNIVGQVFCTIRSGTSGSISSERYVFVATEEEGARAMILSGQSRANRNQTFLFGNGQEVGVVYRDEWLDSCRPRWEEIRRLYPAIRR